MSNRAFLNTELPQAVRYCFVVVAGCQPATTTKLGESPQATRSLE